MALSPKEDGKKIISHLELLQQMLYTPACPVTAI